MGKFQILKEPRYNSELEETGFCSLPSIGKEELENLVSFFQSDIEDKMAHGNDIFISVMSDNKEVRMRHSDFIDRCLAQYLELHLTDYKLVLASYFVKSLADKQVGMHQDPTLVDFELHDDYSIWIPLVDTNAPNTGRLKVHPHSHGLNNKLTVSDFEHLTFVDSSTNRDAQTLNVGRGEPVIFYNRTLHGSEANHVYNARPAVTLKVTPKSAKTVSYSFPSLPKRIIEMREQPDDYYRLVGFKMPSDVASSTPCKTFKF
jgi:hypothetical protein